MSALERRLLAAYDLAPWSARLHVRGRWHSCPFPAIEHLVPSRGRILDVGSGHGLFPIYLAMSSADRDITGVDVDQAKTALAQQAAERAGVAVCFKAVDPSWRVDGTWDSVTIVDVLYLLGAEGARAQLQAAARALAPGGTLIVKEIDTNPRWKYQLARAQELVATKVARITEGRGVEFLPPTAIADTLVEAGLEVEQHPEHRGRLHPHHVIVGRR